MSQLEMEIPIKTLLFLVSAGLAAQTPTPVSLVNPGFETPYNAVNRNGGRITGQTANGWFDSTANAAVQYEQETNNPHGGASCQKIVVTSVGSLQTQLLQIFQLHAGNIYTASIWMRGLPGSVARLIVQQTVSPFAQYLEGDVVLTSAWQQVSAQGYAATEEKVALIVVVPSPGTVWVDDAAVSYVPGTLTPSPNLGPISPSFFGMHVQNFSLSRIWNSGFEPPYFSVGATTRFRAMWP